VPKISLQNFTKHRQNQTERRAPPQSDKTPYKHLPFEPIYRIKMGYYGY
jgi:hypothetical protein